MNNFYFSTDPKAGRSLCLAPMTQRQIEMSGEEIADPSGYFLFEKIGVGDTAVIDVIAHVLTDEGALRLKDMFCME